MGGSAKKARPIDATYQALSFTVDSWQAGLPERLPQRNRVLKL